MMLSMPKKKDIQIHLRLKPAEVTSIDEDRKDLPGVPVGRSAYAKHAVLSYPKLRKLEEAVRSIRNGEEDDRDRADWLLAEAGL